MKIINNNLIEQLKAIANKDQEVFSWELAPFEGEDDWTHGAYVQSRFWDGQKEVAQLLMEFFPVKGKLRKELEAYASGTQRSHLHDPHCGYDDVGWTFGDEPWASMMGAKAVAEELLENFSPEELSVER